MANDKKPVQAKQQLIPKAEDKPTDLAPFVPLVEKWLDGQREDARLGHEVAKEELNVIRQSNHYSFWLLVVIIAAVFTMSAALIFIKGNLEAGLLVLSHVGAIVAGLLAGMGFERARRSVDD